VVRLLCIVLFLVYANDMGSGYAAEMRFFPVAKVCDILLPDLPIKIRTIDLIFLVAVVVGASKRDKKRPLVRPMRNALFLGIGTTVLWLLYGIVRGGDPSAGSWQIYLILSTSAVTFAIANVFRSAADFVTLAKWLLAAALYHATMCWYSYFTWGRNFVGGSGIFLTTHDDTIVWVGSILMLVVNAVDRRSTAVTLRNGFLALFLVGAIQWNSRRIAWISLALALVVLYALFPQGAAKKRVRRAVQVVVPVLALYVAVGWGRQNRIFLPLRSISNVSNDEDSSTLARNAENLGLIATANSVQPALGTGWGHPYIALTTKYDISGFKLWRYMPHNSILMVLAFTGVLGFMGLWMSVPTSVFLNARTARFGNDAKAKSVAIVGAAQVVVCGVQLYGDMGIFSAQTMYALAICQAIALRLPPLAGAWGGKPNVAPKTS